MINDQPAVFYRSSNSLQVDVSYGGTGGFVSDYVQYKAARFSYISAHRWDKLSYSKRAKYVALYSIAMSENSAIEDAKIKASKNKG